jgi:transcription elongation factor GreA
LYFRDPGRVKKQLKQEPLEILRSVVERHDGRASTIAIKNALMHVGVEGGSWSAWWRRTRKLAESSPWFRVTGTTARGDVQLLLTATDPVQDARTRYADAPLPELLRHVREVLTGGGTVEPELRAALLAMLERRALEAPAGDPTRLAALILLREHRGTTPDALAAALQAALEAPAPPEATEPPALWKRFGELASARDQESCLALLAEIYGEPAWIDEALANLQHVPSGMVRALLDALVQKRPAAVADAYNELLARPLRAPEMLVGLARLVETGRVTGDFPPAVSRAQSLLALATFLYVNRRTDAALTRVQARLSDFLTAGDPPMLRAMLVDADYDTLQSMQRSLQRGVDEAVDNLVTDMAMHKMPVSDDGASFWEGDRIWTTKKGRERRASELKHLREVKIPQNEEALGRAAAMGDLSENFEWASAIEEQRNLAAKMAQLEDELKRAEFIENAILPEGRVSPGTWVRYKDMVTGQTHRIEILGPWDTEESEDVVSYRAPLAWGLLGKRPGDGAHIALPAGDLEVEVVEVGALPLE